MKCVELHAYIRLDIIWIHRANKKFIIILSSDVSNIMPTLGWGKASCQNRHIVCTSGFALFPIFLLVSATCAYLSILLPLQNILILCHLKPWTISFCWAQFMVQWGEHKLKFIRITISILLGLCIYGFLQLISKRMFIGICLRMCMFLVLGCQRFFFIILDSWII